MLDSRLPLTVKPVPGGFAIQFADGGQHIFVLGTDGLRIPGDPTLTMDQARELAVVVARALSAAWIEEMRTSTPAAMPLPPFAASDSTAA